MGICLFLFFFFFDPLDIVMFSLKVLPAFSGPRRRNCPPQFHCSVMGELCRQWGEEGCSGATTTFDVPGREETLTITSWMYFLYAGLSGSENDLE